MVLCSSCRRSSSLRFLVFPPNTKFSFFLFLRTLRPPTVEAHSSLITATPHTSVLRVHVPTVPPWPSHHGNPLSSARCCYRMCFTVPSLTTTMLSFTHSYLRRTHTKTHAHQHTHTPLNGRIRLDECWVNLLYIYTHMHIYIHICMYICMHVHIFLLPASSTFILKWQIGSLGREQPPTFLRSFVIVSLTSQLLWETSDVRRKGSSTLLAICFLTIIIT